ncbi:orotidine-5'-phosphate decarboxylase [Micrococcoides hystricis]|uniref:Orotidine 5'-phosphate decarboxylase n=1 Tax=Micrococcoides hystricis TaxID=1572761 RepID=A0ABV6P7G8_9MICC
MREFELVPTFGHRLAAAMERYSPLCLGLDPHPSLLKAWGLDDSAAGLSAFAKTVVEAGAGRVGILKPQVALFERFGSAGFAVLEKVIAEAQAAGMLVINDAKRGDIGSTMQAYAEAWLADGSPLAGDALTVSPYLGFESLRPAINLAEQNHRGLFVLALTSNPEGASVQHLGDRDGQGSVAAAIVKAAEDENDYFMSSLIEPAKLGPIGLVVGATVAQQAQALGIDLARSRAALLAPGLGAQGATVADLRSGFGQAYPQVVPNSSRGILKAGPDRQSLIDAITAVTDQLKEQS